MPIACCFVVGFTNKQSVCVAARFADSLCFVVCVTNSFSVYVLPVVCCLVELFKLKSVCFAARFANGLCVLSPHGLAFTWRECCSLCLT